MEKFKFYYEPKEETDIKSFTISIEEEDKKYKVKVVKEVVENNEIVKIKNKNYYENIDKIINKINSIDFENKKTLKGLYPLVVKYGEKKIEANSLNEVEDICKLLKVKELLSMHIEDIKDIKTFLSN